jgi:hypothetical protein
MPSASPPFAARHAPDEQRYGGAPAYRALPDIERHGFRFSPNLNNTPCGTFGTWR